MIHAVPASSRRLIDLVAMTARRASTVTAADARHVERVRSHQQTRDIAKAVVFLARTNTLLAALLYAWNVELALSQMKHDRAARAAVICRGQKLLLMALRHTSCFHSKLRVGRDAASNVQPARAPWSGRTTGLAMLSMLAASRAHRLQGRLAHSGSASRVPLALLRTQLEQNAYSVGSASTAPMGPVARHARLGSSHTVMRRSIGRRML